jgi:hypothetical protein
MTIHFFLTGFITGFIAIEIVGDCGRVWEVVGDRNEGYGNVGIKESGH